ncbi:MAG: hypothetical protein IJM22_04670 [Treponema sp.]|nr:hypothetical protein [Treponema sp.]
MNKIIAFVRKEIVCVISFALAVLSCFFVNPSAEYLKYINVNVLFLLFSFMAVVAGLRFCGVFDTCARALCRLTSTVRSLGIALVFMCFVFSMFITNDVALLTFVPFTILLLVKCSQKKHIVYTVVLETVAANLGSMVTPMGNPQNLFLFSLMNAGVAEFCLILLPYSIVSAVCLLGACFVLPSKPLFENNKERSDFFEAKDFVNAKSSTKGIPVTKFRTVVYIALFVLCILCVFDFISSLVLACIIAVVILIVQREILLKVDYILLLTFVCFFIFSGNIQNIPFIKAMLEKAVAGHEFLCGILASQVISNVPATLLLSPFALDLKELLIAVDLGGLGTLVASLASLISYKLYANTEGAQGGKFIKIFTLVNVIFIIVLVAFKILSGVN